MLEFRFSPECLYLFCLIIRSVFSATSGQAEWGYYNVPASDRQENWKDNYAHCGGQRQSPIHIYSDQVTVKPELGDLKFTGYDDILANYSFKMTNNGHSVVFAMDPEDPIPLPVHIEDGGLDGVYHLAQFHLHWGSGNDNGSEHWVDDVHYAAELHLVHLHDDIAHLSEALETPNAIAVLGVIIQVAGEDNPDFEDIVSHVPNVAYKDDPPYTLAPFPLKKLLPRLDTHKFYRYEGSLTNPPCSEVVVWSVFEQTVKLSQRQIDVFRNELHHTVEAESGTSRDYALVDNHRLPQPLNGRKVYVNTPRVVNSGGRITSLRSLVILLIIGFLSLAW